MDFYSLSRKELQALCKKNKIPANITNIAMADALAALPQVEGLDEIMNPSEVVAGTPSIQHRTASRTSTQRKAVKEPESSKVSTRLNRGKGTGVAEVVVEQENKDANVSATPAMVPSSRKRVPAVSTRRKKEVVILDDGDDDKNGVQGKSMDVPKTPAVAPSSRKRATGRSVCNKNETPIGTSVQSQRAYSTRRSVRLLGKSLSEMSLVETEDMGLSKIDDISEELSSVSQDLEDSLDTEKGASLQTVSTVVSENTDELEVSSLNKEVNECQSHDSGSELKLVSVKENEAEDELQSEPEEEGSGNDNHVEAEPNDSSLNLQESFDACDDVSIEAGSEQPELEDSCDSAELENKECNGTEQEALSVELSEEATMETADQAFSPFDACDDSNEAGSEQPAVDESCDSAKLETNECLGTEQNDALAVEVSDEVEEASTEIADQEIASLSMEIADQTIAPLNDDACVDGPEVVAGLLCVSPVKDASVILKELVECNSDNQDNNDGDDDTEIEEASTEIADQEIASLSMEIADQTIAPLNDDACVDGPEVVAGLLCVSPVKDASVILKELVECNSDNQDNNDGDDDTEIEEASTEIVDQEIASLSMEIADQTIAPLNDDACVDGPEVVAGLLCVSPVKDASVILKELVECNSDNQDNNDGDDDNNESNNETEHFEPMHDDVDEKDLPISDGSQKGEDDNQVKNNETEHLNVADGNHIQNLEPMHDDIVEQPAADTKDMSSSEGVLVKDERSGNSGAENEVCIESFEDEKEGMEVEKVTHQLSLLGVAVPEAEDQKDPTDKQEAEESEAGMRNPKMMKENLTTVDFHGKSIRELKKMLKDLNSKTKNDAGHMQEVEKKRTALQTLPQNVLPTGEAQNDG